MTDLNLTFAPLLPWSLLTAFALLGAAALVLGALAGQRGTALRALALALVLAALTDPSLVTEKRDPQKTVVAVVIDKSESQNFGARAAQTEEARKALDAALAKFGDVETRFVTAANDASGNDGTKLFGALEQALKDVPPERVGGALLVTDGVVHDIPAKAEALGFRAPIHALITGKEKERDRRIELVEAPRFGIVGKEQTIRARVVDAGGDNARAPITVRRDGESLPTYSPVPGDIVNIPVKIAHGGANIVELEVAPAPGELTLADNKAVVSIEGVRDRVKVLLVSGEPHPGERSWRNLLRADANVELVHFTILRPPEKLDVTPSSELSLIAFPTADLFGRKINEFDLIIFDRYSSQTLLPSVYFENIVHYVENGGAFLAAVGPDYATLRGLYYSPISTIMPARPDGSLFEEAFKAHISKDGEKHPVTRGLPGGKSDPPQWGEWFRQIDADVLKGTPILSGARDKPLLVLSHEGKGRVALLLSDQIWLWARGYEGGGPNADLMRRLAHWLMKEPDLEEEALRADARGREVTVERQTLKDAAAPVTATGPSGAQQEITLKQSEPGLWRARFDAREMGLWRFESDGLTALVNVGPANPREFREVASTTEKLAPLAEATGGTVRRLSKNSDDVTMPRLVEMRDASRYGGSDWIGVRQTGASTLVGVEVAPLGLGLWAMLGLLGMVVAAWAWEGKRG
ncbi:hypothetical protein OGR47_09405 [Methylocystis sp. MJC1]|jgi:hypothetical protein|uniref:hypothetical protein n=1 Tax=Methylocystis sp. MJC1 TaxID=2654282 RepID=UPI0013ED7E44|nr:hypothetical protein [Methylocystis sp. MJC1]KAF2991557.1 hypothetical protein MJC1_01122 [Methylocystis sp. MJC1]MBU6527204.1 hypothetical protein [Methylocystis sp. MJC1]UZX13634.1 hypothetical protein OGR47_09405 [Methylocystis sp. MJC1]